MVKLTGIFSQIAPKKIMVIGDLILDTYTIGKARRISPEAPVAVVHVQREEHRPGGAGNVILNLVSLGAQVVAVGRIGRDHHGELLKNSLSHEGVDVSGIVLEKGYVTPVKNRILADNQQIVRVDHEMISPVSRALEKEILKKLPELLKGIHVIAISDYGKGFLSAGLLSSIMSLAKEYKIPVITDPKGIDFTKYKGSTMIKPNLGEAYAAAGLLPDSPMELVSSRILEQTQAEVLMVTRSEAGISLFYKNGDKDDFPVRVREVKDVTGAGDTVLAMLACAVANGLPVSVAARLSNVAAGIAIERFGCARITLSELASRLLEEDVRHKVFDDEHLFALQEVIRGKKFILLSITSEEGLTLPIFRSIRVLPQERSLIVYIRDESPDPEFVSLLASLREVNFILLKSESLKSLCERILPEEIYTIEQGQCRLVNSVDSFFANAHL